MTDQATDGARDALVAKATGILPVLRAQADRADTERRLSGETLAAMDGAGMFRLRAPARFGGTECDLRAYCDTVAELGRACGSTAWVAFISNATAWIASLFPEAAQREVFDGNPDARFIGLLEPSAEAPLAEGGRRVTGRWTYASNSLHADWAVLTVPLTDAEGNFAGPGIVLIPMIEIDIEDTWYVAGMRGTGSNTVVATDIFVPDHRILPIGRLLQNDPPREQTDETVYKEDFLLTAILMVLPPIVGMARGALDHTLAGVRKGKKISYTFYEASKTAPSVQAALAEAAMLVDNAELQMRRWADGVGAAAHDGRDFDTLTKARARMDFGFAVRCCQDAMKRLLDAQGAGSFAEANVMSRIWRDMEVASRHGLLSPAIATEIYGRALLGIEEPVTPLM